MNLIRWSSTSLSSIPFSGVDKTIQCLIVEINQGELELDRIIPKRELESFLTYYGNRITHFKISSDAFSNEDLLSFVRLCLNISKLSLQSCKIRDCFLERLPILPLTKLDLADNQITHLGLRALIRRNLLPYSLKTLTLDENPIGKEGALALIEHPLMELEELYLAECEIGNEGVEALASSPTLKPKKLDISACKINKIAVAILIKSPIFIRVEYLYLRDNKNLGNGSIQTITQGNFPKLRFLSMTNTQADQTAKKYVEGRRFTLQI